MGSSSSSSSSPPSPSSTQSESAGSSSPPLPHSARLINVLVGPIVWTPLFDYHANLWLKFSSSVSTEWPDAAPVAGDVLGVCLGLGSGTGISAIFINQRIWASLGRCPRFAARANAKVRLRNIQASDWMTFPEARYFLMMDGLVGGKHESINSNCHTLQIHVPSKQG